jgi:drug/metabolite transporter (DMT)-like permease
MDTLKLPIYDLQNGNVNSQNCLISKSSTCDSIACAAHSKVSFHENQISSSDEAIEIEQEKSHFYGYLMGLLCGLCFSLTNIVMKQCSRLVGSEHSFIRYFLQLSIMVFLIKYKNIALFGPKKDRLFLVIRATLSISTIFLVFFSSRYLNPSDLISLSNLSIIFTTILGRFFFKEKLTILHIIALLLTIFGIMFIYRPEFLFQPSSITNNTYSSFNNTFINDIELTIKHNILLNPTIGRVFVILAAFISSITHILTKKLITNNIDYSVVLFYPSLIGAPVSFTISFVLVITKKTHVNLFFEWKLLVIEVIYSGIAATIGIFAVTIFCISHKYEDVSKIAIIKSTDIAFSFIFQYLFLNIQADLFGVFGAISILTGIFLIFILKLFKNKLPTVSGFVKFVFYKF